MKQLIDDLRQHLTAITSTNKPKVTKLQRERRVRKQPDFISHNKIVLSSLKEGIPHKRICLPDLVLAPSSSCTHTDSSGEVPMPLVVTLNT